MAEGKLERDFEQLLRKSVNNNDVKTVRRLVKGGVDVNKRYWYDGTLLHDAVANRSTDMVELLIHAKADVNLKNKDLRSPLHIAARVGNEEIFNLLLTAGANIDDVTSDRRCCLHIALWKQHLGICKRLVESGCDVNIQDSDGSTPLFWAVKAQQNGDCNLAITQLLVENGADVNVQNKDGQTPLFEALHNLELTRLLVENGASVNVLDQKYLSPVAYVLRPVKDNVLKYLVQEGGTIPLETWEQIKDGNNMVAEMEILCALQLYNQHLPSPKLLQLLWTEAKFKYYHALCDKLLLRYKLSPDVMRQLIPAERNVLTLQCYCRSVVRKTLSVARRGRSISPAVNSLFIPQNLKDFLMLSEWTSDTANG